MQIVLGIDTLNDAGNGAGGERCPPAEVLLRRLRFSPLAQISIVHVHVIAPPTGAAGTDGFSTGAPMARGHTGLHDAAAESLRRAASRMSAAPFAANCRTVVREGPVVWNQITYAQEVGADLIAVNEPRHGTGAAAAPVPAGSVARGLFLDAQCSVLISRPLPGSASPAAADAAATAPEPLRAVVATDHSQYANRCLESLILFAPQGIGHMTVLSAYTPKRLRKRLDTSRRRPAPDLGGAAAMRNRLTEHNDALLAKLREGLREPFTSDSRVVAGPVHEAVAAAMDEACADLLILAAHGHYFLQPVTPGSSVSYREAMTSPYSVLALRCAMCIAHSAA